MLWYIIMGAVMLIEAGFICFLIKRAVVITDSYEVMISELESEIVEKSAVPPRETVAAVKKVFEEEW